MGDGRTTLAQRRDQRADLGKGRLERLKLAQLAADMNRDPAHIEAILGRERGVDCRRLVEWDTKLVLAFAGRNFLMRARIDIGVHPQRAGRARPMRAGESGEFVALFLAFDVELADPGVERPPHFGMGLADAREDDVLRVHSCGERADQLAAGHDVSAEALVGENLEDGEIGVRLDRERELRVVEPR